MYPRRQEPRLVADLHSALGRRVSTGEAKAWVRALDRLGQGLDKEKLLDACLVRQKHRCLVFVRGYKRLV